MAMPAMDAFTDPALSSVGRSGYDRSKAGAKAEAGLQLRPGLASRLGLWPEATNNTLAECQNPQQEPAPTAG